MAIAGKVGAVYASDVDTAPAAFVDQATTPDAARKRYQVTNPDYRYWPVDEPITVKKNGEVMTTGYTLERAGGFVVFEEALLEGDAITVSGNALTIVQCGGFFNWSVDTDDTQEDATTYESNGWKENQTILKGWNGSAEAYWGDGRFFKSLGKIIVVKLFVDAGASQRCMEGFVLAKGEGIEVAVDALVKEKVEFAGVGPLYPRF